MNEPQEKEYLYRCNGCSYTHIESEYRKSITCRKCPAGSYMLAYLGEQPIGTGKENLKS